MDRARALTMQLLTFAKGGAPVQRTTELIPFLRDAVRFALSGSRISCQFALAQGLWACSIDKNQIGQVIDNIVINAQQAMPDGGGIEMAAENVSREEGGSCLASGRYVRVSIRDFGVGIPAEVLPRIFDPFFTTKPRGHGLGLATCYSIVKRHGGFIEVESEPGKGSAFHVYLPASSETVGANQASTVTRKGIGKIIVVDDEEVVRTTLRRMLEVLGYSVLCKSDGRDGIAAYINETKAGEPFVAMILDLTVPGGMGGVETVAEMRKLNKEMPIFVSSGYADDCVMRNPADYGFTASISKPFTIAELSEMLGGNLKS
jgi:CheY-like chemotaxis protein